jgi:hypothetical protein
MTMATITTPQTANCFLAHGECFDGWASLWLAWLIHGDNATYKEVFYNDPPPDVTGLNVAIFDFAYDRDVLENMAEKANSIIVLDHHATNQKKLEGLEFAIFDMARSGARMTYDWLEQNYPTFMDVRPQTNKLTQYVQDRDLWTWALPNTREISAAMMMLPFTFEAWSQFAQELHVSQPLVVQTGAVVLQLIQKQVEKLAESAKTKTLGGIPLWVVNGPYNCASELGNYLSQLPGPGVAAIWRHNHLKGTTYVSLRASKTSGVDVSLLAEKFGGGGHKLAAGFECDGNTNPLNLFEIIVDAQS